MLFDLLRLKPVRFTRDINHFVNETLHDALDILENVVTEWSPSIDIRETDEAFFVRIEAPGMSKEDLKVEVRDNTLFISGKKETSNKETVGKLIHQESYTGSFSRSIPLSRKANADNISAALVNGVLNLTISKKPESASKLIAIA